MPPVNLNSYTLHINLYAPLLLVTIAVGLTFALLLGFTKRADRDANRLLALSLATIMLYMASVLGTDIRLGTYFPRWSWLPLHFSLALGPLIFCYVRKITRPERRFVRSDLLHWSPLLLELGTQLVAVKESIATGAATYDTRTIQQLNPVLQVLAFISVCTYLYSSRRLIAHFYQQLKFNGGDRYRCELRWLRQLLTGFGLVWLLWIPCAALKADHPMYLLLAVMAIRMAAVAFLRPGFNVPVEPPAFVKPPVPAEMKQKGIWLKHAVKTNRYYQNPELSLNTLAENLGMTTHELSGVINTVLRKSFNDFINEFRVAEAIRRIQDPAYDHITLLGIAYDSGFNSRTTFHRIFKQMTGKSPAEYKARQKKRIPSYNLEHHRGFAAVISSRKINPGIMFKNYFKTAFRSLSRRKGHAFLNISGLSAGFAAFLLIFLVINYEESFDQFHAHKGQLFRVVRNSRSPAGRGYGAGVPLPVTDGLRKNYPQLASAGCITTDNNAQVIIPGQGSASPKKFREAQGVFFAEPQFFDLFTFPMAAGDHHSLNVPGNILLTQATAGKYFGDWHEAMGKTFNMDGVPVKVTGILKDIPANTDFQLKEVVAYVTLRKYSDFNNWANIDDNNQCFVQLAANQSPAAFNSQLKQFSDKYIKPVNNDYFLSLQSLGEMHVDARYGNYSGHIFSKDLIFALRAVGMFLLVIACVNFINLSTAQALNRAREVGVRKVLGGSRSQLIAQFLGEAAIISFTALILSLLVAACSLSAVNNLLGTRLAMPALYTWQMLAAMLTALAAVILLSGGYPAFVLSGFQPARVLKSTLTVQQGGGLSLRRLLVVLQFAIAQVLIIATLVVVSQTDYFTHADMGFRKDAIITAQFPRDSAGFARQDFVRNELQNIPGITQVSFATEAPVTGGWGTDLRTPGNTGREPDMAVAVKIADTGYFSLYHIEFVAGRPYSQRDTAAEFVVNQTVARKLGYLDPRQAIGKMINVAMIGTFPIVGVVKDFHTASFRDPIPPVVITANKRSFGVASIKLDLAKAKPVIAAMKNLWDRSYPDFTFEYAFMDQTIAAFYTQETQLSQLYRVFVAMAIFISCLGLYGMIAFMAAQRKKEIGIRKVFGAPVRSILVLLLKEFTLLIGLAFLIAAPLAWYLMHQWLQQYPYRIALGPWFFLAAISGSVLIAWMTVGYTAIHAARANPVKSLRTE